MVYGGHGIAADQTGDSKSVTLLSGTLDLTHCDVSENHSPRGKRERARSPRRSAKHQPPDEALGDPLQTARRRGTYSPWRPRSEPEERLTAHRFPARGPAPHGDSGGPAAPGSAGVSGCHTRRGGGSRPGRHRSRRGLLAPGRGSGRSPSGTPSRGRSWSSSGRRCRPRARTC
jgi:hypothetical protein